MRARFVLVSLRQVVHPLKWLPIEPFVHQQQVLKPVILGIYQ